MNYFSSAAGMSQQLGAVQLSGDLTMGAGAQILADYGTSGAPGYAFNGRPAEGFLSAAAGYVALSSGEQLNADIASIGTMQAFAVNGDLTMNAGTQILADSGTQTEPGYAYNGDPNTGRFRSAADVEQHVVGGGVAQITSASGVFTYIPLFIEAGALFKEQAAPVGAADYARLFAVVDGGGKTDLSVIFQTGAAIVVEQEA